MARTAVMASGDISGQVKSRQVESSGPEEREERQWSCSVPKGQGGNGRLCGSDHHYYSALNEPSPSKSPCMHVSVWTPVVP